MLPASIALGCLAGGYYSVDADAYWNGCGSVDQLDAAPYYTQPTQPNYADHSLHGENQAAFNHTLNVYLETPAYDHQEVQFSG